MVLISILYIILGFFLLTKGGDYLVDGSVAIAKWAKLSNMVIGLTIIGFGTSAPELLVSTLAALEGSPGIAIGNVVGSNIANIALIIGATAIIYPITATKITLARDLPFMILSAVLMVVAGMAGTIERWEGIVALSLLITFVWWQIKTSRKHEKTLLIKEGKEIGLFMPIWKAALLVLTSITALVAGANLLINGAFDIAMTLGTALGVGAKEMERVLGLTVVAVGTSLPEMFATVMAAKKKRADMALGNIIGSVTFNILSVVGTASAVCPIQNTNVGFKFDYIIMLGLTILLWIFLFTGRKVSRIEGTVLLCIYVIYMLRTVLIIQ